MGLLGNKQKQAKTPEEQAALLFTDELRDELSAKGREYFQKVIDDSGVLFKQDLEATLQHVNTELRQHIVRQLDVTLGNMQTQLTKQIDEQFIEFDTAMKKAQDEALASIDARAKEFDEKSRTLSEKYDQNILEQNEKFKNLVAEQEAKLQASLTKQNEAIEAAYNENKKKIDAASEVQAVSMQALSTSVKALQKQHDELGAMIERNVANQEAMILELFESNLAQVVEHYLLKALGDQIDVKSQLPAILAQLDADKQDMMDDMKL